MKYLLLFWLFLLGATLGSFLGAAWYRIKHGENLSGRSRCPTCMALIPPKDNVPIFSWLILRGRSRCCNTPLSPHYLILEVSCAVIVPALALVVEPMFVLLGALLAIALVALYAHFRSI